MAETTPPTPAEPVNQPTPAPGPQTAGTQPAGAVPAAAAGAAAGAGPAAPAGVAPAGPDGGPASPPRVGPWLTLYTLGRIAIAVVLVVVLWLAGLGSYAGLLFGVLLSMPVSYLALRPVRDRLTEALAARSVARRAAKEDLRARLSGDESDDA